MRQIVNMLTLGTPLGLLLARMRGVAVEPGPYGIRVARGYPPAFPAPRACAVTVGDVVLLRVSDARSDRLPQLLDHEARHCAQYACCLGPLFFLPAYGLAAAYSWLRTRHPAHENWFEVRAGLVEGGYVRDAGGGLGGGAGRSF